MARRGPFKISSPGTQVGLVIAVGDALARDDYVDTVSTSASDGDLMITNEQASDAAETVDGVEYAAGKAITFDLAAASGMTPSAPPTTEYEVYFDITTTGGEAHRIKKTVTVETRLEAL